MRRLAILILLPLTLAACASPGLRNLTSSSAGPDEFLIKPVNSLEQPGDFSNLPAPTPGKANLADRSAINEGIVAFGGRPDSASAPIPASDSALVQHASRNGVDPNIRTELAERDAKFRKRRARFTRFRIEKVDNYNEVYKRDTLAAGDEAERWRRKGARTPSSRP